MKQKHFAGVGACIGMLILILDSKTALASANQGLQLCLQTVIPSLFPFFLLSGILSNVWMGASFPMLRPIGAMFAIPTGAESLLIPMFFGGYPCGAQTVAKAWRNRQLKKQEAERLLAYCNNAGPAFLFGMVSAFFPETWMPWALWGIHILSAAMTASIFRTDFKCEGIRQPSHDSISVIMRNSVLVTGSVCGWVMVFRILIGFFDRWFLWLLPAAGRTVVSGILELSNGCLELSSVANVGLRFFLCSGMLASGGLCVTMQTAAVTQGLSLKYYMVGKLLQTSFSLLLSAAVCNGLGFPAIFTSVILLCFAKGQKKSSNPGLLGV